MEFDIGTIITLIISALTIFAGGAWLKVKGKFGQVKTLIAEALDVVTAAVEAVEDNKVSEEEIEEIKKEAQEVADALAVLLSKQED